MPGGKEPNHSPKNVAGVSVVYDVSLEDMEELQASLLLVGTHFVASAREHHAGAAATFQVDTLVRPCTLLYGKRGF